MEKRSGHLSSSAAHRAVQSSTMLDRRYVKRPSASPAGRYSTTKKVIPHEGASAPSRLVNLNVHATDLEVAQISEAIRQEVAPTPPHPEIDVMIPSENHAEEEFTEAESIAYADDGSDYSSQIEQMAPPDETLAEETTDHSTSSPASMYSLEAIKRSMMQDLVDQRPAEMSAPKTLPQEVSSTMVTPYDTNHETPTLPEPETNSSIDMISKATSDALASIRIATESSEVSEQMASLKAFADSIKSDSPEMSELSNTIEKFANVAMKSSKAKEEAENKVAMSVSRSPKISQSTSRINRNPTTNHRSSSQPSTLTRSTPRSVTRSPKTAAVKHDALSAQRVNTATSRTQSTKKTTTRQKLASSKDQSLEKALRSVATMNELKSGAKNTKSHHSRTRRRGGLGRFMLALGCATACIAAVVYFVGSNIPDVSVKVAAMQTGIEASYPSYIPQDYSLGDISSEDEKIIMRFNGPDKSTFTIVEEKSSWDSASLQHNYVEPTWGDNYTTTHEQGITIYISNSDAAWVNGGILYKITSSSNGLTKKQLRNIVTSM